MLQVPSEFIPPYPPSIRVEASGEERNALNTVTSCLYALTSEARSFTYGISLISFCTDQENIEQAEIDALDMSERSHARRASVWSEWRGMGGSSGALSLRNFVKALEMIQRNYGLVAALRDAVDGDMLKGARKMFDKSFPRVDKLRHSVAHPEMYSDPTKAVSAAWPNDEGYSTGSRITLSNVFVGNSFVCTIEDVVVGYPATREAAIQLLVILDQINRSFAKACYRYEGYSPPAA